MTLRDYYEGVWEGVPEGLASSDARVREAFLLDCLARERERAQHLGSPSTPHMPAERHVEPSTPRVLDVGCGEGHFAALLARAGAEVVAIDVAEEPLRRALARHPDLDLRLVAPHGPWPLRDSGFDVVWAGETIEHVFDTAAWLSEVRRVLRSGGLLALSTPDHGALRLLWLALRPRRFDAHFDPRSDHLRFYTRRTLAALLADFGFEEVEVRRAAGLPGARRVLLAAARRRRF